MHGKNGHQVAQSKILKNIYIKVGVYLLTEPSNDDEMMKESDPSPSEFSIFSYPTSWRARVRSSYPAQFPFMCEH